MQQTSIKGSWSVLTRAMRQPRRQTGKILNLKCLAHAVVASLADLSYII